MFVVKKDFDVLDRSPLHLRHQPGESLEDHSCVDGTCPISLNISHIKHKIQVIRRLSQEVSKSTFSETHMRDQLTLLLEQMNALETDVQPILRTAQSQLPPSDPHLRFMAFHDALTHLPNRQFLHHRISTLLLETPDHPFALLFLDLDGFKSINDRYGHAIGDWLLTQVGERLRGCVRATDFISRYGGDEFVIVLENTLHDITPLLKRLLFVISQPFFYNQNALHVSVSIGVALYPEDGTLYTQLIQFADQAMYQAKKSGKNSFLFHGANCDILKSDDCTTMA